MYLLCQVHDLEPGGKGPRQLLGLARRTPRYPLAERFDVTHHRIRGIQRQRRAPHRLDGLQQRRTALILDDLADQATQIVHVVPEGGVLRGKLYLLTFHSASGPRAARLPA